MKAKSIKGKTKGEIKDILDKNMADGFQPTVAIMLLGNDNERDAMAKLFTEKSIQIFGTSTGDNFLDGEIESGSNIILLLDIRSDYFEIEIKGTTDGSIKEIAEQIGRSALSKFKKPAFLVVSGGLTVDGDEIIEGIEN